MATTTPTTTAATAAAAASAATSQHDLDGFTQGLYRAAHAVTQISNRLPLEDDFAFHKATTSGFNASMSAVALHAVTLLQQIVNSDPSAQPLDALGSVDDVDEFMSKLPLVIDANETRLEAVVRRRCSNSAREHVHSRTHPAHSPPIVRSPSIALDTTGTARGRDLRCQEHATTRRRHLIDISSSIAR